MVGRLTRTRGGHRSTRKTNTPEPTLDDYEPTPMLQPRTREHQVGSAVFKLDELKGMICTNLPGRIPFISS